MPKSNIMCKVKHILVFQLVMLKRFQSYRFSDEPGGVLRGNSSDSGEGRLSENAAALGDSSGIINLAGGYDEKAVKGEEAIRALKTGGLIEEMVENAVVGSSSMSIGGGSDEEDYDEEDSHAAKVLRRQVDHTREVAGLSGSSSDIIEQGVLENAAALGGSRSIINTTGASDEQAVKIEEATSALKALGFIEEEMLETSAAAGSGTAGTPEDTYAQEFKQALGRIKHVLAEDMVNPLPQYVMKKSKVRGHLVEENNIGALSCVGADGQGNWSITTGSTSRPCPGNTRFLFLWHQGSNTEEFALMHYETARLLTCEAPWRKKKKWGRHW